MENRIELKTTIQASAEEVWDALTNPDKIEKYMFGVRCKSNWKPGSRADFYVTQNGKEKTAVKGEVIRSEPNKLLEYTLFPTGSGIEDILENYLVATFEIVPDEQETHLLITQRGYAYVEKGEERYIDTIKGWKVALPLLKEIAEND